ncbi:MAG: 5-formyltetrahydrofolate cyclo-ligase [Candidatus Aenigmarchaeota archaeon]
MKHLIRKKILSARENHKGEDRFCKDCAIKGKMFSLPEFKKAKIILFYVSVRGEVRTDKMISESLEKGKRILVPFANLKEKTLLISEINNLDELEPGAFGIPEPKKPKDFPLDKIDLVVIPGIAFDKKGNRVGYGMGFYDRFLKTLKKNIPLIALAYDLQIVNHIPTDGKDVRIHKIITEKEIIEC